MGWKNFGIGKKLGIGFGGLMLLLALISIGAVAGINRLMSEFDLMDQHTQLVLEIEKKERDHLAWLNELNRAIITGTADQMTLELDGHNCALGQWYYGEGLKKAKTLIPELGGMIATLEEPHHRLHASASAIWEVSRLNPAGAKAATEVIYTQQTLPALNEVRAVLGTVVAKLGEERASAWSDLVSIRETVRFSIVTVGVGALLFGLIIATMTTLGIVRPVRRLTESAEKIAEGDLSQTIEVNAQDEIGQLASAFNKMTQVIVKNLTLEVDRSSRLVRSVKEAIHQLLTSANEILAISTQQASGATEQASAVQQATTTSEEIAATARQVVQNALQVESQAVHANTACTDGISTVDDAVNGMVQLRAQVQAIAEAMLQLGENSQKIGGIVDIIDEISDQTNLLSLNAAIEAAGAGEAGKRFAIVAGEVKRLAERTVDATRQIKSLIEQIQKATNSTIMLTEEGTKGVDSASIRVESVSAALARIIAVVQETTVAAREIKLSTQQQTTASEQMAETITEVRDVASQVAASAEETTQAIAELTGLAENLREMLEEELQNKGREKAKAGAGMVEKVLAEALTKNHLSQEDLFDENYVPIPDTDPPKFHTRYDTYLDQTITRLQDAFLDDGQVVYAVLVDRNGYLPTHNSKYTQPLTGNREKDLVGNRTKRMFNTPNELAAARNTNRENALVLVYHRDTGEKMWDISFPVYLGDRHWGAFRIGYCM